MLPGSHRALLERDILGKLFGTCPLPGALTFGTGKWALLG